MTVLTPSFWPREMIDFQMDEAGQKSVSGTLTPEGKLTSAPPASIVTNALVRARTNLPAHIPRTDPVHLQESRGSHPIRQMW
jgi:hypothetical protein